MTSKSPKEIAEEIVSRYDKSDMMTHNGLKDVIEQAITVERKETDKYRTRLWRMRVGPGDRVDELEAEITHITEQVEAGRKVAGLADQLLDCINEVSEKNCAAGNACGEYAQLLQEALAKAKEKGLVE